jgi:hypothetical protein
MDDKQIEHIAGVITAQDFVLQSLYAILLSTDEDPVAAARNTGAESIRQFTQLPTTNVDPVDEEAQARVLKHGEQYLRRYWKNVERRLQKVAGQ